MNMLEEGSDLTLDFGKLRSVAESDHDVIPVVIQDADSERVLFVRYANQQALSETLLRREAVLWSTSRDELWHKGATSGDVLKLEEVRVNCEQNSLLYRVRPARGGACHTRDSDVNTRPGCYYRRLANREALEFV